jgi:hypothetical protein
VKKPRAWLESEVKRMEALIAAYNLADERKDGGRVLSVSIESAKFPPNLVVTAPGMDERKIAAYLYNFYALLFATYTDISKSNSKAIASARKIYLECAALAEKYGHAPCAAELRRRGEQFPAIEYYSEDVVGTVFATVDAINAKASGVDPATAPASADDTSAEAKTE